MKRRRLPEEALTATRDYIEANPRAHVDTVGRWILERWPESFLADTMPESAYVRTRKEAQTAGLRFSMHRTKPPPSNRTWQLQAPELVLPYQHRSLVISDSHFPLHAEKLLTRTLRLVELWQPHYVWWNGDFLDNAYKGHKGSRDVTAPAFVEGLHTHAEIVSQIAYLSNATQVFLKGNHDDKPERDTDMELPFSDWLKALWWTDKGDLVPRDANIRTTDRYYALMEPMMPKAWPFVGPENFPWRFSHQKNYGKIPGSVAMELSSIHMANMVCGHQHHISMTKHKSGLMYTCDAGTFQDPESPRYKQERDSRHPQWGCGFLTINHCVPEWWPASAPDDWWEAKLR